MSYELHQALSHLQHVRCAVVTISDTRTEETDRSGTFLRNRLQEHGHQVLHYAIVPDEPEMIGALLDELAGKVDVILTNGGTGISGRDTTYEVVAARLEKTLPGFGELFRMLSFQEIGSGAMLSRAIGGVYRGTLIFALPGSLNAVKLALDRLLLPELRHLVWEIRRHPAAL